MKKIISLALIVMFAVLMAVPSSAALEMENDKFESSFTLPSKYEDATHVVFADHFVEGATNARIGSHTSYDYVYLKEDGNGDFTVTFTVDETALYDFGLTLMGWKKSVLRSTDVIIDDGPACYMGYEFEDADQHKDFFFFGIQAVLEAGEHTLTLSLSDDFDDSSVKSLYIVDFFYVAEELPEDSNESEDTTTTAPSDDTDDTAAKTDDTTANVPTTGDNTPDTFDPTVIAVVLTAASGAAFVVASKKRK